MKKILILFLLVLIISMFTADARKKNLAFENSKFAHRIHKRSADNVDDEYINYMKGINWQFLEKSNLTLSVGAQKYKLSHDLIKEMADFHSSQ